MVVVQKAGRIVERWIPILIIIFGLTVWEIFSRFGMISILFFPPPSVIAASFYKLAVEGKLASNTAISLSRVFSGFLIGGIPGIVLGLIMGWSPRLGRIVDPFVAAFHPIPKIALLPLIMIIFGIGETSKIVVVSVAAFFPLLINTMAGVRQISPVHFEVARNYGAKTIKVLTRVILPGSLPLIFAGLRLALNISLLITIAIELVSAENGLGNMIWFAWETLRTEELYVSITVTAFLGVAFNFLLQKFAKRFAPWQITHEI